MQLITNMAPDTFLQTILSGLLLLVGVSCGVGVLLDFLRWFAGDHKGDPGQETLQAPIKSLKDRLLIVLCIGGLAVGGANFARGTAKRAGVDVVGTISNEGAAGWQNTNSPATGAATMGEALTNAGQQKAARAEAAAAEVIEHTGGTGRLSNLYREAAQMKASGDIVGYAGKQAEIATERAGLVGKGLVGGAHSYAENGGSAGDLGKALLHGVIAGKDKADAAASLSATWRDYIDEHDGFWSDAVYGRYQQKF